MVVVSCKTQCNRNIENGAGRPTGHPRDWYGLSALQCADFYTPLENDVEGSGIAGGLGRFLLAIAVQTETSNEEEDTGMGCSALLGNPHSCEALFHSAEQIWEISS